MKCAPKKSAGGGNDYEKVGFKIGTAKRFNGGTSMNDVSVIYMNFSRANVQAEELSSLAERLRQIIDNDFESCLAQIARCWSGENPKAFLNKAGQMKSEMTRIASKLDSAAQTIIEVAAQTKKAELAAIRLAKD